MTGVAGLAMIGTVDGDVPIDAADDERLLAIPSSTYRRMEQRTPSRLLLPPITTHLTLVRQVAAHGEPLCGEIISDSENVAQHCAWWDRPYGTALGRRHIRSRRAVFATP
jgi:hypothetical protein